MKCGNIGSVCHVRSSGRGMCVCLCVLCMAVCIYVCTLCVQYVPGSSVTYSERRRHQSSLSLRYHGDQTDYSVSQSPIIFTPYTSDLFFCLCQPLLSAVFSCFQLLCLLCSPSFSNHFITAPLTPRAFITFVIS